MEHLTAQLIREEHALIIPYPHAFCAKEKLLENEPFASSNEQRYTGHTLPCENEWISLNARDCRTVLHWLHEHIRY